MDKMSKAQEAVMKAMEESNPLLGEATLNYVTGLCTSHEQAALVVTCVLLVLLDPEEAIHYIKAVDKVVKHAEKEGVGKEG